MSVNSIDGGLSNPFSTGGGGVTFEQLVGASYLVSLLAGDIPRGLDWGVTKEVSFQHRWSGCLLDDIVITGTIEKVSDFLIFHPLNPTFSSCLQIKLP
ncbi:MAG: hypothetical protein WBE22_01020 [Halobacteriota archaeon]